MTFALQILILSSIFCVLIITLLLIQKRGYLKHKIFTFLILFSSILFLIASSAFFYYEYSGFQSLKNRHKKPSNINQKLVEYKFNNLEIDVLEEFSKAKNILVGYENFLEESARNYNPDDFSYDNLLKEEMISKFQKKEYSLEYWQEVDTILNSIYKGENPYGIERSEPYYPIVIVPSVSGFYNAFQSQEDREFSKSEDIEYKSKIIYLQRKIKSFDRSSKSIVELWKKNKMFIYTIMSKSTYNSISKMFNDLISIYDRIIQEPNYIEFYKKHNIYADTDTDYKYEYDNEVFLSFPTKEFVESYTNYWGFGFWDRRIEEENEKVVYEILKEIQTHYKD